jgi:hypothetical protein
MGPEWNPCPLPAELNAFFEECYPLKRTLLFTMLAVISAVIFSVPASGQVEPAHKKSADSAAPDYKWEVFAGFAYTSLNQVTRSRYGLVGLKAGATRDFGRYFGLTAEGSYYKYAMFGSSSNPNPGDPRVTSGLAGPVLHADIYGRVSGFIHGLIGVEHSGGESQIPATSFAGGFGGGLEYKLNNRLSLRATGDNIGASFSPINNSKELGYSAHLTWNPQASFSAVYHF